MRESAMLPLPGEELLWEGKGGALAEPNREVPPRAGARATISTLHRRNCTVRTLFSPVAQSLLLCRLVQLLPCGAVRCGKLAVLPVLLHTQYTIVLQSLRHTPLLNCILSAQRRLRMGRWRLGMQTCGLHCLLAASGHEQLLWVSS